MSLALTGCGGFSQQQERNITMEAFSDMKTPFLVLDTKEAKRRLLKMAQASPGKTRADRELRRYYQEAEQPFVWVDRQGVDERADSLLAWLHLVGEIGMSEQAFSVEDIEQDLRRMRTMDFAPGENSMTRVAARLEYRLSKACMRYCYGQRFGFVNPFRLLNNLDVEKKDTVKGTVRYRELFDLRMDHPGKNYVALVLDKVRHDSIAPYLREIQPRDAFYNRLKTMLQTATTAEQRMRIMVNMERSRWRLHNPIPQVGKRVIVNIPAYHLYAFSDEEQIDMRVVCGNVKTKTPILESDVEYMEVNPQWVIPMSIIEHDVARRAGDTAYFARNRYRIYDKTTQKQMPIRSVTKQMLLSGNYRVAQEGGAGNSLGRIIFRFKNNFSVYLHDTSNPDAFNRNVRAVSHGCVRVSEPFQLARFVLDNPDEWLMDRIRIAMGLPAETIRGIDYEREHPEVEKRNKLIGYVTVKPRVPIYIIYYTLWPDENGVLQTWPDVYGYDEVVWKQLIHYRNEKQ